MPVTRAIFNAGFNGFRAFFPVFKFSLGGQ